jgi:hypothetical protein
MRRGGKRGVAAKSKTNNAMPARRPQIRWRTNLQQHLEARIGIHRTLRRFRRTALGSLHDRNQNKRAGLQLRFGC